MNIKPIIIGIFLILLSFNIFPFASSTSTNRLYSIYIDNIGTLSGYVRDTNMNPIEGAKIIVYFHDSYEENYSDSNGYYNVNNIPICFCLKNTTVYKNGYKSDWVLLAIGENTIYNFTLIQIDNSPPFVNITNPTTGLYLFNQKTMNLPNNIIAIGPIDIIAEASDDESGIDRVEYELVRFPLFIIGTFQDESYIYRLNKLSLGQWHVTITAYDNAGNKAFDQIQIWKYL